MKCVVMGLLCCIITGTVWADDPRKLLGLGDQAYCAKQFEAAQQAFAVAAALALLALVTLVVKTLVELQARRSGEPLHGETR